MFTNDPWILISFVYELLGKHNREAWRFWGSIFENHAREFLGVSEYNSSPHLCFLRVFTSFGRDIFLFDST